MLVQHEIQYIKTWSKIFNQHFLFSIIAYIKKEYYDMKLTIYFSICTWSLALGDTSHLFGLHHTQYIHCKEVMCSWLKKEHLYPRAPLLHLPAWLSPWGQDRCGPSPWYCAYWWAVFPHTLHHFFHTWKKIMNIYFVHSLPENCCFKMPTSNSHCIDSLSISLWLGHWKWSCTLKKCTITYSSDLLPWWLWSHH